MIDTEVSRTFDRRSALFLTAGAVLTSALVLRMLQMQLFNYREYTEKSENNSVATSSKDIILMHQTWLPVCSSFIPDNVSKKRFYEDLEWFIYNHYEYYYDKKKERKNGVFYGKDLSNDKVIERLKKYLERKLQINPSWPQISEDYRKVPIDKIIDYLTMYYGKR